MSFWLARSGRPEVKNNVHYAEETQVLYPCCSCVVFVEVVLCLCLLCGFVCVLFMTFSVLFVCCVLFGIVC